MKRLTVLLLIFGVMLTCAPVVSAAPGPYPAKAALLMEAATGTVLYAQNEHEALAPASVTKVMTLLLIMEAIDGGQLKWEDTVTASEAAAAKGGSQVYLKVGETMTVEEMVKSIAVSSANDCACAMAEHLAGSESAFVERMNRRAAELGMTDTHFVNCTGLDDGENAAAHKTSANDIALMSRELLVNHPEIKRFTTIWMDSVRGGAFGLSNTNKLVRFYNGCTGLKTGFTSAAGYCLSASAQRDGMELIAVTLGAERSQQRFDTCRQLLDYGFAGYGLYRAECPDQTVPVRLGRQESVGVALGQADPVLLEKGQLSQVITRVQLVESVTAPVSQGQQLGTLEILCGQQTLVQLPLTAAEAVPALEWVDLFVLLLKKAAMAG